MERKSFTNKLSHLIRILMFSLILLLIIFIWLSYKSVKSEMDITSAHFIATYGSQMENRIISMERVFAGIIYGNTDFNIIRSDDDLTRHYAAVRLQKNMSDIMTIDANAEFLVVAEGEHELCLDGSSTKLTFDEKNALRDYTMGLTKQVGNTATQWEIKLIGEKMYLVKASIQNNRAAAIFLSIERLMNTIPDPEFRESEFYLTDAAGVIYGIAGHTLPTDAVGRQIQDLSMDNMMEKCYDILEGHFQLYVYERNIVFYQWMQHGMIILVGVVLMLYLFTVYLKRDIQKELIIPMNRLTEDIECIQKGDYELRIAEYSNNREFSMLARTFNKLMDEIINLKIRNYEKKLELQEADQKYIQLQLRPHFFLNAMATVASMNTKGKIDEIDIYIQELSKNIRYMFSSGMHTVPVKEEVRHVENYLKMQELKYPGCIFSCIDLPEELEAWRIPQMLIHTIVENEYRYVVSRDVTTILLIKITAAELEGERMLLIEIEDDGDGYPKEVLNYMNGEKGYHKADGTRVGLWSIRRLLELMYDRKGLFRISNIQPHGALNQIYIPQHVVHEIPREKREESGVE